jgi:hypothetical protein
VQQSSGYSSSVMALGIYAGCRPRTLKFSVKPRQNFTSSDLDNLFRSCNSSSKLPALLFQILIRALWRKILSVEEKVKRSVAHRESRIREIWVSVGGGLISFVSSGIFKPQASNSNFSVESPKT